MQKKTTYKDVIRFSLHYWGKQWKRGLALVSLMILATVVDTFIPIYTGRIVDILVTHKPDDDIGMSAALETLAMFMAIGLSFHLLRWLAISLWARFAVRCLYEILTDALYKVQRFSADWHANTFAGGTVRKITRGMWSFDLFGDTLFMGILPAVIIMFSMTFMLLATIPMVGLFVLFMIFVYCGASIWMSLALLAPRFRAAAQSDTQVGAFLADIITGNPTVKTFAAESREEMTFGRRARLWQLRTQKAWLTGEVGNLIRGNLRMIMLTGMVAITIWMWAQGDATPGDIALCLSSFFIVGGYLRDIGMHIAHLQKAVSEMEDVVAFWVHEEGLDDAEDAEHLNVHTGEVTFKDVRFVYNGQSEPLFEGLSIRLEPGEKVALVGHSGSGKSSFVKLIQRLHDLDEGQICIDGQNIAHVTQKSLRENISLVPQDPVLFHRSLAANIAYGRPGATMDDIIEAAKQAYAHDFIMGLPEGYGTLVGERGVKLSGGERQRVAIARAILADAPILILDEATSALDSVSEHYIQKALAHLMEGRTTIIIAHRLSTIRDADRILVFEKGRIIEQGTHHELLSADIGRYRELYQMQAMDHI